MLSCDCLVVLQVGGTVRYIQFTEREPTWREHKTILEPSLHLPIENSPGESTKQSWNLYFISLSRTPLERAQNNPEPFPLIFCSSLQHLDRFYIWFYTCLFRQVLHVVLLVVLTRVFVPSDSAYITKCNY